MGGIANQQLAAQQAANQAQSGMANQIAGQEIGGTQAQQAQMLGGAYQQNANAIAQQQGINQIYGNLAQTQMKGQQDMYGGMLNGIGVAGMLMADGGEVGGAQPNGPASSFGTYLKAYAENAKVLPKQGEIGSGQESELKKDASSMVKGIASSMMSTGGMAQYGGDVKATNPKQKAIKTGDSYANDKIEAVLSEGEVVIPRSIMQSLKF
jgi:hypothetical protein